MVFIWATKNKRKLLNVGEYVLCAQLLSVIAVISLWYNNSSRYEIACILFFALAAPIAIYREATEQDVNKHHKLI